ncbi:nuclear pore complex protein NUP214-like isoform X1 [Quercus robur]|uniref:nuclear pore complex protein NUP214-like isoform X1 n=1 Tax=Quercus robur TaxID=38942 RepID=UPI002163A70B|nr:nuclear pore complex protein NUP214-like isoform X1 [Quercus robur]
MMTFLRDYDRLQSFAVILIYIQIGCTLIGSLGALYNGVLLINLGIALFALVAIESRNQKLSRTYAVLLFCALPLDVSWFILFTHDIWNISSEDYGIFVIFSLKLALAMQIIGFTVRLSSSLLWIQIYRLGVSYVDTTGYREADYDLRNSFLSPATPAVVRQPSNSDYILGGSISDPAYYSSLFEGQENRCSHGSWAKFEPSKTTVKRIPLQEHHNASMDGSSFRVDQQHFNPHMLDVSATERPLVHTSPSTYSSQDKGIQDTSTKRTSKNTIQFTQENELPAPSSSQETTLTSTIGTTKDKASTTKGSLFESGENNDIPFSSTFDVSAVPTLSGKFQFNVPVSKSEPGENVLVSSTSLVLSAPSSPMIKSMTAPQSSSATPTFLSPMPLSRPFTTSNAIADANLTVPTSSSSASPSLITSSSGSSSLQAPKTSVPLSTPISESPKTELLRPMAKSSLKTDKDASKQVSSLQSEPPKGEIESKLEPSVTTDPTIEISTSLTSGSQPSFSNLANPAPNVTLNAQPAQPSTARVLFPTPLPTSGSATGEKNESLDVAEAEEDEMEEEAPETRNTAELSLGSLGAFGIGSTPTATAPKSNLFGGTFGNAASSPMSSAFDMTVPSGQLFRPASSSFQSPQSSQPSQPTNSSAFSGGFSTGTTAQAPTQTGFGQPAQIGSGQQALGSVLGSFGQPRQIGTSLPGTGFGSPSGFGGGGFTGTSSPGGFSSAATGGGFAGISSTGGFAGVASGVAGFASVASAGGSGGFSGGGFAGAPSAGGGFAGAPAAGGGFSGAPLAGGGFAGAPAAGGGFGAFNSEQGSGFSAFSGWRTGKPTELFTQIRK